MSKIYLGVIAGEAAVALFVWEEDTERALCKKLNSYTRRKGKIAKSLAYWEKSLTGGRTRCNLFLQFTILNFCFVALYIKIFYV